MYFVIYSSDPYLLARLCTELQMMKHRLAKYGYDNLNGEDFSFKKSDGIKWMAIYVGGTFCFYSHPCIQPEIRLHLLEKNYTEVLETIIKKK